MNKLYSLENAQKFQWSSISGNLNSERVSHLKKYLVGNTILDAGCGGGAYVDFLSRQGLEVTGIDKYNDFLQVAVNREGQGNYVQGDLTNLPFLDRQFDCTYCFDVLEHIDDSRAIKELARVTKKRLIIAVPKEDETMSKFNLTFLHYQDKTHLRNYTEDYLNKLVSNISYSQIRIFPELAVPTGNLVKEMIEFESQTKKSNSTRQKIVNFVLMKLLNRCFYQTIHTELVAIIDI